MKNELSFHSETIEEVLERLVRSWREGLIHVYELDKRDKIDIFSLKYL